MHLEGGVASPLPQAWQLTPRYVYAMGTSPISNRKVHFLSHYTYKLDPQIYIRDGVCFASPCWWMVGHDVRFSNH